MAEQIAGALRDHPASDRVEIAGSLRRLADSAKDIDIIATASDPVALTSTLAELPLVESVQSSGEAGARVRTHSGMKVDLRVVAPDQFGNVLQHFTGAKAHNVQLREAAVRRGLHVSEYGILDDETGETTRCATEEEVYERLGLAWIPPELREGRGELEAAAKGTLPHAGHARGPARRPALPHDAVRRPPDRRADGRRRRSTAAGSTWRSPTTRPRTASATTSPPRRSRRGSSEVAALNARSTGSPCWPAARSTSCRTAALDYPDELLARLDWVIASVHTSFAMDEAAMTDRMVAAIEHPWVDAIGHPTGRKIETRAPYALDMHAGDRGGGPHRHDDRDQLRARPPRPQRGPRPRGRARRA